MNLKAEQKERTHEAILASASKLLRERGIAGTSVSDVMRGAGLTVGGFYAHFESKEALFAETLRRSFRELWRQLATSAQAERAKDRAVSVVRRYLSRAHRDTPEAGCPLPASVAEVARGDASLRTVLAEELSASADMLAKVFGGGSEARQRALGAMALMYGGLALARATKGAALSDELLKAARAFGGDALEALLDGGAEGSAREAR